eukprot:3903273-Prymnesium_polylepis.1
MAARRRTRARCSSLRNRLLGRQVRLRHGFDPLRPNSRSRPGCADSRTVVSATRWSCQHDETRSFRTSRVYVGQRPHTRVDSGSCGPQATWDCASQGAP